MAQNLELLFPNYFSGTYGISVQFFFDWPIFSNGVDWPRSQILDIAPFACEFTKILLIHESRKWTYQFSPSSPWDEWDGIYDERGHKNQHEMCTAGNGPRPRQPCFWLTFILVFQKRATVLSPSSLNHKREQSSYGSLKIGKMCGWRYVIPTCFTWEHVFWARVWREIGSCPNKIC